MWWEGGDYSSDLKGWVGDLVDSGDWPLVIGAALDYCSGSFERP